MFDGLSNIPKFRHDPIAFLRNRQHHHGDVFSFWLGPLPIYATKW